MIQFGTRMQHNVLVIAMTGSLDAITAEEATVYLDDQLAGLYAGVVLNVEGLEYISSAGVRVLLGVIKNVRRKGCDLRLASISRQVLDTLDMAGITSIVKYYDGIDTAVASFED